MATTTITAKRTNGVSIGMDYAVTAQDAIDRSILFDFGLDYDLVPSLTIKNTDALKAPTGLQITRPAKGQILLEEGITLAVAESSTVECVANTTGGLNGTYFLVSSTSVNYYVWYSTDGTGVDPAVATRTGINVDLPAGDSTDAEVAAATQTILDAHAAFIATVEDAIVTVTNSVAGAATNVGAGDSGFTVAVVTAGADEIDASTYDFVAGDVLSIIVQRDYIQS